MKPSDRFQEENRLSRCRSRQEIHLVILNTASQEVRLRKSMVVGDIQPVVHVIDEVSTRASSRKVYICSTGLGVDRRFRGTKSAKVPIHLEDMVTHTSADLDLNQRLKLERLLCNYANIFDLPDREYRWNPTHKRYCRCTTFNRSNKEPTKVLHYLP